jgi:YhcH/YjgK/YiaL family protein
MIFDSLSHSGNYLSQHPLFAAAFAYLRQFDPVTPDGKYELDGKRLFAMVQRYDTAPEETRAWEAHRAYADIQFIVSGRERLLYVPVEELKPGTPYNEAKDVQKYPEQCLKNKTTLVADAGSFCVFLPQDGHKPGCMADQQPEPVVKVVIKVQL